MDAIGRGRRESVVRTMAALAGLLVGVAGCAEQETPDLNGIWQTPSSAHWNVEPHAAHAGPGTAPDALTAARGGLGIVEGGDIPYQPWARVRQQEHFRDRGALDPLRNCYLPGVPRANYLPYPLQIVQTPTHVLIAYEFAQASRTVYLDRPDFEAPIDGWMGHSLGRWEGDTLVVDVTAQLPDTWLDQAGNFHGAALHVRGAVYAGRPQSSPLRSHAHGSGRLRAAVDAESVLLYRDRGPACPVAGLQVRGVRGGADVRRPHEGEAR